MSDINLQQVLALCIEFAIEFRKTKSKSSLTQLNYNLQIIASSNGFDQFQPDSSTTSRFYITLHELVYTLNPDSELLWTIVKVLQQLCQNASAQFALSHTYKFLPVLSRFLTAELIRDKKVRLLTLLQELTYGIKISWEESYLVHLISNLVKFIQSDDTKIIVLALSVLINLCFKNLPAVYSLMRCVNTKVFMRNILCLKDIQINIQICKLLLILEGVNGDASEVDILKFVDITFKSLNEALEKQDAVVLRHTVEFFAEAQTKPNQKKILFTYKNYGEQISGLIENANVNYHQDTFSNQRCIRYLLNFFCVLTELKKPEITDLNPKLVTLALRWIKPPDTTISALKLLHSIMLSQKLNDNLVETLSDNFYYNLLLQSLDNRKHLNECNESHQEYLTVTFQLFREMIKSSRLRQRVMEKLELDFVLQTFRPITSYELTLKTLSEPKWAEILLYINSLLLIQEISSFEVKWKTSHMQLMNHKKILDMLALAFQKGNANIKSLIFDLAKSSEFQPEKFAQSLTEIQSNQPLKAVSNKNVINVLQSEKIDNLINKLEDALASNRIQTIATSEVMELFEYKLATVAHSDETNQISLNIAAAENNELKLKLGNYSSESTRLHQMLFHSQQSNEQNTLKLTHTEDSLKQITAKLAKSKIHATEFENQFKVSAGKLDNKIDEISANEKKYEILLNEHNQVLNNIDDVEQKLSEVNRKNNDLYTEIKKMEDRIVSTQKKLDDEAQIVIESTQTINKLTQEVEKYVSLSQQNDVQLTQKENDYQDVQNELEEYKSKLEWIVQISKNPIKRRRLS